MPFKYLPILLLFTLLTGCASMGTGSVEEKRKTIKNMKNQVLTQLYRQKPYAKEHIQKSDGYAVFSNANINLIFMAAGTGYGLAKNMKSGKVSYMNMAEGGVGLGLGVKDYRLIMVFHTEQALNQFLETGWTFGGNADVSAKAGKKGASIEGEAYYGDVTVYTFTESGLAFQATIKGTKFWQDGELNN